MAPKTSTIPLDSPRFIQVHCTQNVPNATEHELDRQFWKQGGGGWIEKQNFENKNKMKKTKWKNDCV